jgi:hypothetical protein
MLRMILHHCIFNVSTSGSGYTLGSATNKLMHLRFGQSVVIVASVCHIVFFSWPLCYIPLIPYSYVPKPQLGNSGSYVNWMKEILMESRGCDVHLRRFRQRSTRRCLVHLDRNMANAHEVSGVLEACYFLSTTIGGFIATAMISQG